MNSLGIIMFLTIALATASFTSLTVEGPQQAMAKPPKGVMKSLIANVTKMGVLSIPITCTTIGDVMGALPAILGNAAGGNETNSTQGISGVMGALSGMLGNATTTAAGGNETSSIQEMITSGMQNMSQSKLQHLSNLVFCSPANERTIKSLMK